IIKVGEAFSKIEIEGNRMICGSGALLSSIARQALGASLTGFEFAAGIPGSMGGAVFMNAGAYGGEIKDCLKEVLVLSKDGKTEKTIGVDALELGYRTSRLQETGDIVLSATLEFAPGEEAEIRETMKTLFEQRNTKQPVNFPSAGSFFKRPTGYFAGKLIQDAGLKGLTVGGAQVSALHAGFIINIGGATATDIIQLMHLVQAAVMEKFGVMLEPEVRILGED
ncbi:MAG: UDP-N-acetylmuramate dehydrogenase, partial [Anaerovoracaceae bacterium]